MSWPMVSIKSVAKVTTGKTPSKKVDEYFGGHIPFISPAELGNAQFVSPAKQTLTEAGAAQIKLVPKNSVLVCCIGSLGKLAIADQTLGTNQQINSVTFDEKLVFPKYGYYALSRLKPILESIAPATTVAIVSKSKFEELEIPLPPLEEQKRIAAILDKADAIRQKRKQAIALTDEFLRSVFLDMFGDPVTNPKGWEVKEVSTVCTEIVDCVNRTAPTVDYETPYKMIRTTNVRDKKINLSETRYVEFETYKLWIRRLKPQKGDLIFTREAPAGEAGVIETDDFIFLGQRTMHFRPDQTLIHPVFLLHELTASGVKRQIVKLSAGSTVTHLSVPECKKFLIRVPSIAKQLPFVNLVRELDKKVNRSKESLLDSDSLFNALSQKAFSGQL
ncbi:restriction endonuclease subunit S [Vibrio rotiferianus]|uniref:restriction endonuclease subunit S n=1 Tax=Vibrio rotiferianus TaxID=190895 RepID=UPI00406A1D48